MAMSFVRPDPSSPASVADAAFGTGRRGFDQTEVRDFLRMVAAELGRLQERERFLERELRTSQAKPDAGSAPLDDQTLTRMLGEETARVLITARESAAEIRQKAEASASQLVSEASDEAKRLREEAETEASRRRSDAAADAEAELAMAKQQGREMVNEARAYRERVLSELSRRRELAREQIEQLLHGRDRLIATFENARVAAVDVIAELQPLGEPSEYVNLAPTTGPVPVMVPNSPRPAPFDDQADPAADATPEVVETAEVVEVVDEVVEVVDEVVAEVVDTDADIDAAADIDATVVELVVVPDDANIADADAAPGEDVAVEPDAVPDADLVEVDEEPADEVVEIVEGVDEIADEPDDQHVDDPQTDDHVVVDLFARLRADATTSNPETADIQSAAVEPANVEPARADGAVDGAVEVDDLVEVDAEVTPFEQRDADLTPLIVASAKKIKRVLADEQNEVLDALRRNDPVRGVDALLPAPPEHLARYRAAIADDLSAAAHAGASSVTPGRVARLDKAESTAATAAAEAVLDEWLIVPLRERLDRCVIDGGGDNADVTRRVRAVYREWKTQHIDEQLDDVILTAHGRGAFAAIAPGTSVVWTSDRSHAVCSDCDDNTLSGQVSAGDEFPTGHVCVPAHLGCRCILVPAKG